jgi:hypothetical protein
MLGLTNEYDFDVLILFCMIIRRRKTVLCSSEIFDETNGSMHCTKMNELQRY